MDHGLMTGMLWGGLVMMAVPVLFGLGVGAYVLHRFLTDKSQEQAQAMPQLSSSAVPAAGSMDG
jgi:Na+/proline symporter